VPAYPGTGGCERNASLALVAQWYAQLQAQLGVASLTYVNPFEFGFALDVPDPAAACPPGNRTAYCVANALYRGRPGLGGGFDAALVGGGDYTSPANWSGSTWLPSPTGWPIAPGVKVLDPAVEPYRGYVVASLQAQLAAGGAAGFCMDRMDHASHFSRARDDGVAWDKGGPAAWLGYSHLSIAAALRDVAHAAGSAAVVSLLLPRLDLVGGLFDAFLNEHGDSQKTMPLYGLLGMFKPTSGWYWPQHLPPPVELYLRQCLVAGQSPQVPWALADHGDSPADAPDPTPVFLAYAPLYRLLVQKRWLLSAGAVELAPEAAAAGLWSNAFFTASGLLLVVADGLGVSTATIASVTTNLGPAGAGGRALAAAFALYPGGANVSVVARRTGASGYAFDDVPLVRGALVLQLVFAPAVTAAAAAAAAAPVAPPMPSWSAPAPNASAPLAGYSRLPAEWTKVLYSGAGAGDYNHASMLHYHNGVITVTWKNGEEGPKEDAAGQRVLVTQSADGGASWTPPALLFAPMNTSALPAALFAGPFAVLNGNLYASASPGIVVAGSDAAAQGAQFCLYPDGLDPRNAGPPGQKQPEGVLMLRRVLPALGAYGPPFWVAGGAPAGFAPAGAAAGVLALNETDAQTQLDVSALLSSATDGSVPCDSSGGTEKCEACARGCQPYFPLPLADRISNERTHWTVPASNAAFGGADVLLYRGGSGFFYASSRLRGTAAGDWAPVALSGVPNDNSNLNAGTLPDGRVFLVHNPLLGKIRDPLTVAISDDGLDFSAVGVVLTCTEGIPGSGCGGRAGVGNNVGPSYPQALAVQAPAPAEHQGFYVVATNNKEDVVITKLPFSALPQTARSRAAAAAAATNARDNEAGDASP
jgi:hypothetical protein